jgi:hypothetical protein
LHFYQTISDDNVWRATVCASTEEATAILGRYPDITALNGAKRNEKTEHLWAAPRTLFIKNFEVFPPAWEPVPPEAKEYPKEEPTR